VYLQHLQQVVMKDSFNSESLYYSECDIVICCIVVVVQRRCIYSRDNSSGWWGCPPSRTSFYLEQGTLAY